MNKNSFSMESSSSSSSLVSRVWEMREHGRTGVQAFPVQESAFRYAVQWGWRNGLLPDEYPKDVALFTGVTPAPKHHGLQLPIFGYDVAPGAGAATTGAKKFVAASYDAFYAHYAQLPPQQRFYYELLQEGLPCHLHVDAEFKRKFNPQAKSDAEIHGLFCSEITEMLRGEGEVRVLSLDASNERKFSRHYIIKVVGRCFANNYHCGAFMRRFCNRMIEKYGAPKENNPFFFLDEQKVRMEEATTERVMFFCDLAVYTRNRQFRIYGSTKRAGEYRPLLLMGEEKTEELRREKFEDLLIQRVTLEEVRRAIMTREPDGTAPKSTSNLHSFRLDAGNLMGPEAGARLDDTLSGTLEVALLGGGRRLLPRTDPTEVSLLEGPHRLPEEALPLLCAAIREEWRDSAMQLSVRKFSHAFKTLELWSNSKRCRIAGRDHNSNHITFRVSLPTMRFYQACFDPAPPCCLALRRNHRGEDIAGMSEEERERLRHEQEGYPLQNARLLELLERFMEQMSQSAQAKPTDLAEALHGLNRLVMQSLRVQPSLPL